MAEFDTTAVSQEDMTAVEADTFWCMTNLLDNIQVGRRSGCMRRRKGKSWLLGSLGSFRRRRSQMKHGTFVGAICPLERMIAALQTVWFEIAPAAAVDHLIFSECLIAPSPGQF